MEVPSADNPRKASDAMMVDTLIIKSLEVMMRVKNCSQGLMNPRNAISCLEPITATRHLGRILDWVSVKPKDAGSTCAY